MQRTLTAVNTAPDSENEMHGDAAADYGFSGGLVPGVDVLGYLAHHGIERWGVDWLSGGRLDGRLLAPVYDGDELEVCSAPTADGSAGAERWQVVGEDGETRAEATLTLEPGRSPDPDDWEVATLPEPAGRPAAEPALLEAGTTLGTQFATFRADRAPHYLDEISEDHPVFRDDEVAHPGWLLRFANWALSSTVRLGPWIHVGSDARWFAPVRDGDRLEVRATVTERWEKKGQEFVDLDVLYLVERSPVALVSQVAIWRPRRSGADT